MHSCSQPLWTSTVRKGQSPALEVLCLLLAFLALMVTAVCQLYFPLEVLGLCYNGQSSVSLVSRGRRQGIPWVLECKLQQNLLKHNLEGLWLGSQSWALSWLLRLASLVWLSSPSLRSDCSTHTRRPVHKSPPSFWPVCLLVVMASHPLCDLRFREEAGCHVYWL